jgi:protein TonB
MFSELIESKRKVQKNPAGTLTSIVVHSILIALVVTVTARAGTNDEEETREEQVSFVELPKNEPPPPEPEPAPPPPDVVAPPPPKGFQVLTAPVEIPDVLPEIDLSKKITDEADFSGKGVAGGVAKGVVGGTGPTDQPYFEFQVEKPVLPREGNPSPQYPEMLRSGNVQGEVLAQFVVDTTGKVEMNTFKVLKSDNELFTAAVKRVLPRMKFYPAETGGRKVKQLVQQPFAFKIG